MGGFASQRETKEKVILTLPSGLARQITDKANAMHVSVDAAAVVLLTYGLKVQGEREQEIENLFANVEQATNDEGRDSAVEVLGASVFNK
jgi:hypothetical protein